MAIKVIFVYWHVVHRLSLGVLGTSVRREPNITSLELADCSHWKLHQPYICFDQLKMQKGEHVKQVVEVLPLVALLVVQHGSHGTTTGSAAGIAAW